MSNIQAERLERVTTHIAALVDGYAHSEPYPVWVGGHKKIRRHITRQPGLIDQLREAVNPSSGAPASDETGGHYPPGSRPAARWDAVCMLDAMTREVALWVAWTRSKPRPTVEGNLRALIGYATNPKCSDDALAELDRDVHGWHGAVRVLIGWDSPAFTPNVRCPMCQVRNKLHIRDERYAVCVACRSVWDDTNFAFLVDDILRQGATPEVRRTVRVRAGVTPDVVFDSRSGLPIPAPRDTTVRSLEEAG